MMKFMDDPTSLVIAKKISDDLEKAVDSIVDIRGATHIKFIVDSSTDDPTQHIVELGTPCFTVEISLCDIDGEECKIPSVKNNRIMLHVYRKSEAVGVTRYIGSSESYRFASWDNFFLALVDNIMSDLTNRRAA